MNNSNVFLEKYRNLEKVVRDTYNLEKGDSISHYLKKQSKFRRFTDELTYCQDIRNFLVHEKNRLKDDFPVIPSEAMIKFVEDLTNQISNQPKCSDIQIKYNNVYWRSITDTVKDTMYVMRDKLYTHIPILDSNGIVIGVFDENSIFTYLAEEEIISIDDDLKFSDIENHISISEREMETFVYVKLNTYVEELEAMIEEAFNKGRRIGLAFVTSSGKSSDRLQGIITPWDIIKANNNN